MEIGSDQKEERAQMMHSHFRYSFLLMSKDEKEREEERSSGKDSVDERQRDIKERIAK